MEGGQRVFRRASATRRSRRAMRILRQPRPSGPATDRQAPCLFRQLHLFCQPRQPPRRTREETGNSRTIEASGTRAPAPFRPADARPGPGAEKPAQFLGTKKAGYAAPQARSSVGTAPTAGHRAARPGAPVMPAAGRGAVSVRSSSAVPGCGSCSWVRLVQGFVDIRDFHGPAPALTMLHIQQLVPGPVEMVGDIGYLLVEPVEGVA
jgi:hypothetical protein